MSEISDTLSRPLPWNRSIRPRLQQSKKILPHVYAGEKADEWKELEEHGWDVITLDITKGKGAVDYLISVRVNRGWRTTTLR